MQNYTTIIGIIEMRQRGISYDDCQARYGIGSSTLQLIMKRFKECGKELDSLRQMPSDEVEKLFYPPENIRHKDESVMPDYQDIYSRLTAPGSKANLFYLWLKYKADCPSGYQYTQFCKYFKDFVQERYGSDAVSMVVERIPGERVYIDWIGDQPEILVDTATGASKKVHFFVTTIGVSSLIYAEAFEDEKMPRFIAGTIHALEYYGAVPKYLVPDNLKAAVARHSRDELVLTSAYQDLESFYDVVVLPPPPRKPKGKPTVEKYVQFLETHLLEDLKEKVYYSIEDINRDVRIKIAAINNAKKTPASVSKMEAFLRYDKSYLANALCICALRQFKTARYLKASQLINDLSRAEKLGSYQELLGQMAAYDLLVVDDFGLMNLDVNKCRNLFEVFDSRDPFKSMLVISQFPVSAWYDMFKEHTYAEACLARLLNESYRLEMNGRNMRNLDAINNRQP